MEKKIDYKRWLKVFSLFMAFCVFGIAVLAVMPFVGIDSLYRFFGIWLMILLPIWVYNFINYHKVKRESGSKDIEKT